MLWSKLFWQSLTVLSLMHMFPLLLHMISSASLREEGRKGRWVGTSDVMLTSTSNGKLDSFRPHELPCFLLSFFLSCDGLWLHVSLVLSFTLKSMLVVRSTQLLCARAVVTCTGPGGTPARLGKIFLHFPNLVKLSPTPFKLPLLV